MADRPHPRPNSPHAHAEPLLQRSASSSSSSSPSPSRPSQQQPSRQSHDGSRGGGPSTRSSQDTTDRPGRRDMLPPGNERAWGKRSPTTDGDGSSVRKDAKGSSWEEEEGPRRSNLSSPSTSKELDRLNAAGLLDGMDDDDDEEAGLKSELGHGRWRRRRKRTNTFPLSAIPLGPLTPKEEGKMADLAVVRSSLVNVMLIALWYIFSLSISLYNKWMFSPEHLDFHFPLFTTCLHMLVQFLLASTVLYLIPSLRPRADSLDAPKSRSDDDDDDDEPPPRPETRRLMTPQFYLTRIGPCGAATGLDIGLGNMSLKFITLTFFTMCKSSALAFVLLFAFLFRLETPSVRLILIIATMTVGVIMMVAGEAAFNLLGFVLIILSAFFSGFRWALTQILLLRNPATSNPFASIFFLAPVMFVSLFILAVPVEGFRELGGGLDRLAQEKGAFQVILLLLFPGIIAFCMTSSEFALLQRTSVVTLSICGIFKEVVTIAAAGIAFHDPLTPINVSGLVVTIASIAAYNYIKIRQMREKAREAVQLAEGDEAGEREGLVVGEGEGQRVSAVGEDEDEDEGRKSTAGLIEGAVRQGLAIDPGPWHDDGRERGKGSPVKRAEDLE